MEIRRARSEDLVAAARLLAGSLRFTAADAIPPWFMRTTDECGGLTLVAAAGARVVGASYAVPARDDLFSCGLAVAADHRGRRLGLELKRAQRREARALGYARIRWTTDPVNGRALRVYLSHLGARAVGYRAGLHDGLRTDPGHPQDDLDVVWELDRVPELDLTEVRFVRLPWSAASVAERLRVREEMSALLGAGWVGCGLELDRSGLCCRVTFSRVRR